MKLFPVVAILGPRQCGKSTLARDIGKDISDFQYIDLEDPSDRMRINDLALFFNLNKDATVCIDEAQLMPNLFPELRSIVDKERRNGQILLLGPASRELVNKSAESLAGRIGYIELSPFTYTEIKDNLEETMIRHWIRGGFPLSFLAESDRFSEIWRKQYILSYLERDVVLSGNSIPLLTIQRLLQMLANNHGQVLNSSQLGSSLGINYHTVRSYIDFFEKSFITRTLHPFMPNLNKRINKSPKVYIRDSGILHSLLDISAINQLLGHPGYGFSWEGYVIENILNSAPEWQPWFYRTATGNEIDLLLTKGNKTIAIECKATLSPEITRGTYTAMEDLKVKELFIVAMVPQSYFFKQNIQVGNLTEALNYIASQ
ncbi:MAG: ATP-binding protein [Prolixibacteraceae bacterium]